MLGQMRGNQLRRFVGRVILYHITRAVVGGDRLEPAISAASILAKVTRDRQLEVLDQAYPQYGFAKHKGYPTAAHLAAIEQYGVLAEHRRSYAPVKKALG